MLVQPSIGKTLMGGLVLLMMALTSLARTGALAGARGGGPFASPAGWDSSFSISGRVSDSAGRGLSEATVRLIRAADTLQVLTGSDGRFAFSGQTELRFTIEVSMQGYGVFRTAFEALPVNGVFRLPSLILNQEYKELQEVVVSGFRPVGIRGDTLVYDAAAYSMRTGAILEDLVRRLPGLTLTSDSGLMVMGSRVRKLMLDGKPFYGGDVQTALRNLPYDIIDKVEIIDDYGDLAVTTGIRASAPEKILNITIKKDKNNGIVGNVGVGGGTEDQYVGNLMVNRFRGVRKMALLGEASNVSNYGRDDKQFLSLNYADAVGAKWSVTGQASYSSDKPKTGSTLLQDNFYSGGLIHLDQTNSNESNRRGENFQLELLRKGEDGRRVRLTTSIGGSQDDITDRINQASLQNDSSFQKNTTASLLNQVRTRGLTSDTRFYFGQALSGSGQKIVMEGGLKYLDADKKGDYLSTTRVLSDTANIADEQHYHLNNQGGRTTLDGSLRYYVPIGKGKMFDAGYGIKMEWNRSDQRWLTPNLQGDWKKVDSLSNDYRFKTQLHDFRAGYSLQRNSLNLSMSLTGESGVLQGSSPEKYDNNRSNYFRWLPAASLVYALTKGSKLTASLVSSVNLPTLQQVQPATDLSNAQYPVTGNPFLKPSVSYQYSLRFEGHRVKRQRMSSWWAGLSYTKMDDMIVANLVHPRDSTGVIQHTYYTNSKGTDEGMFSGGWELPGFFHNHLKISTWSALGLSNSVSLTDGIPFYSRLLSYSQFVSLNLNIQNVLDANWSAEYSHNSTNYAGNQVKSKYFRWRVEDHHYFFKEWRLSYLVSQSMTSTANSGLEGSPVYMEVSIDRSFLAGRRLNISAGLINALNSQKGFTQIVTPNVVTQQQSSLLGRIYMIRIKWMFEQFKNRSN